MNQRGFAVTGVLYTLLLLAIVSLNLLLYNLLNRKNLLDQIKTDTVNAIENDSNFEYLIDEINKIKISISIDKIYPIGSVYITTSNVNPSSLFEGTTWERYAGGRTLVGVQNGQTNVNEVGGQKEILLTTSNLPSHSHEVTPSGKVELKDTSHTHSIPILNGTTDRVGGHYHVTQGYIYGTNRVGILPAQFLGIHESSGAFSTTDRKGGDLLYTGTTTSTGEHQHKLTTAASKSGNNNITPSAEFKGDRVQTSTIGGGDPISVQDPYITVYMWKRVS